MVTPLKGYATPPPPTPTGLRVEWLRGRNLRVSWDPSNDQPEFHKAFKLYRSTDGNSWTLVSQTRKTEYIDRYLTPGTYYYKVTDLDKFETESDPAGPVSIEIKELLPYADTITVNATTTIDFYTALGRRVTQGSISNQGPQPVTVELSYDGTSWPESFTMQRFDVFNLQDRKDRLELHSIRFTSTDSEITIIAV